jgi:cytidylate kinase
MPRAEVLFIGGRAGVGKTSVAVELHALLAADRIRHCLIEGDNLDQAWPTPWERGLKLAELNLAAMWGSYQAAGYSRMIYTNTAAVRSAVLDSLLATLGGDPVVHAVLLTAADATVATRLAHREIGSVLDAHLDRSERIAPVLEESAPDWVHRINTDGHTVTVTAQSIKAHLDWAPLAVDLR